MNIANYIGINQPSFAPRVSGGGISIVPVTSYQFFRLSFPGTQSGFVRVPRFQLYETMAESTNVANGATTSQSTAYSGSETFAAACDNDAGTQWAFNNGVDAWGKVDLGEEKFITLINLRFNTYPTAGRFVIEGSKDDSVWDVVYDSADWYGFNSPGFNNDFRRICHANYVYEVVFTGTNGGGFRDIGYMDLLSGGASILTPYPNHIFHFGVNNAYKTDTSNEAWQNIANPDLTLRGTFNIIGDDLRVAMHSPNTKATHVSMSRASAGGNAMPNAFSVRYSADNGQTFTTIYTTSGLSWASGENKTFELDPH